MIRDGTKFTWRGRTRGWRPVEEPAAAPKRVSREHAREYDRKRHLAKVSKGTARRTVSVRPALYEKLREDCIRTGTSMSSVVELVVLLALDAAGAP